MNLRERILVTEKKEIAIRDRVAQCFPCVSLEMVTTLIAAALMATPTHALAQTPLAKPNIIVILSEEYPEITAYSRGLADVMYSLADKESVDFMQLLQDTWSSKGSTTTSR